MDLAQITSRLIRLERLIAPITAAGSGQAGQVSGIAQAVADLQAQVNGILIPEFSTSTWDTNWYTVPNYNNNIEYRLMASHTLQVYGMRAWGATGGTALPAGSTACNSAHPLPSNCRPSGVVCLSVGSTTIGARARIELHSDGIIYAMSGSYAEFNAVVYIP